jgi:hypothetical protein
VDRRVPRRASAVNLARAGPVTWGVQIAANPGGQEALSCGASGSLRSHRTPHPRIRGGGPPIGVRHHRQLALAGGRGQGHSRPPGRTRRPAGPRRAAQASMTTRSVGTAASPSSAAGGAAMPTR